MMNQPKNEIFSIKLSSGDVQKPRTANQGIEYNPAATSHLKQEHEFTQRLFNQQSILGQRFIENQASQVAEAYILRQPQIRFVFPSEILATSGSSKGFQILMLAQEEQQQIIGGLVERLAHNDTRWLLKQRFAELEASSKPSLVLAAQIMRYAIAATLVHRMLPAGRTVTYQFIEGEDIPSLPDDRQLPDGALTDPGDSIPQQDEKDGKDQLQIPYVLAAQRFYLPQWIAFDAANQLLVSSLEEAKSHLHSMRRYLEILHSAVALAPYMVADPTFQQKRYGILGQYINQGRCYAAFEVQHIIQKIQQRASSNELNRGLSLNLPYFDDQALEVRLYSIDVIPGGRIMFIPAFLVLSIRQERAKVAQDTRLSPSTRKHLLLNLEILETAFSR